MTPEQITSLCESYCNDTAPGALVRLIERVWDLALEEAARTFDSDCVVVTDFTFEGVLKWARRTVRALKSEKEDVVDTGTGEA